MAVASPGVHEGCWLRDWPEDEQARAAALVGSDAARAPYLSGQRVHNAMKGATKLYQEIKFLAK